MYSLSRAPLYLLDDVKCPFLAWKAVWIQKKSMHSCNKWDTQYFTKVGRNSTPVFGLLLAIS
jgi:hypothetical protein